MAHLEYCSNCGKKNKYGLINAVKRYFCTHCGCVHYENPKPAATLICPRKNELLVVERAFEPAKGQWCLPGGFMELGETPELTAQRELKEETNLDGIVTDFLGYCSHFNTVFGDVLLIGVIVEIKDFSNLICGDDAVTAKFFHIDNIPQLAFKCHNKFVELYRERL